MKDRNKRLMALASLPTAFLLFDILWDKSRWLAVNGFLLMASASVTFYLAKE